MITYTLEKKHWNKLNDLRLVGKNKLQGENENRNGGIWYLLLLASQKKISSFEDHGITSEQKTHKNYSIVKRNLDRKDGFKSFDGENLVTKQALNWKKKSFDIGVIIKVKKKMC